VLTKSLEAAMMAHGSDPVRASRQAYVSIWGMIQRQASMQAFVDTFLAMAVVFMLMLPLLLLMKKPKHYRGSGIAH
jgi:DHA2 family multidrug resistance protein